MTLHGSGLITANPGCLFSITQLDADLKSQGIPVGRESLYQFLAYLEDAFLLRAIPVATDSKKRRQVNPRKIYPITVSSHYFCISNPRERSSVRR